MAKGQLRAAVLAALVIAIGVVAESTAPSATHLLTAADLCVGSACAVAGAAWSRSSLGPALVVIGVGLLWFAGTAASGWTGSPTTILIAALFAYRAPLVGLASQLPGAPPRLAAGATLVAAVAVLLPVRAAGLVTAADLAAGAVWSVAAARTRRIDLRAALVLRGLLAASLAVLWASTALGATGDGLQLLNDLLVVFVVAAIVWPAGAADTRGVAGRVVIELGSAADAVTPVVARLRTMLADDALQVRFRTGDGQWVDDVGWPVEAPDPSRPDVTQVMTAGGTVVALLHGPQAAQRADLSNAAAAASGLARDRVELDAEARRQAAMVAASRRRLLNAGDNERRALESELRSGPLTTLAHVDELLAAVDVANSPELRQVLRDSVDDLLQLGRGLYPSSVSNTDLEATLRGLAASSPFEATVEVTGDLAALSVTNRALVWFVCSEGLTNVVRHAEASAVTIRCGIAEDIVISVTDNGRGGAAIDKGHGLRGIADRLEVAGGRLTIQSPPGGPTTITATVDLPAQGSP